MRCYWDASDPMRLHWGFLGCETESGEVTVIDPGRKGLKVSRVFHRNSQVGSISQKSSRQPLGRGGGIT